MKFENGNSEVIVLGGGLAGLSAGYALTKANKKVLVFEGDSTVGGLSRTIVKGEFRFDLGGHRFFTRNEVVERFVRDLMGEELLEVPRSSKICLRNRFFDYPLKPSNAIFGLGVPVTLKILFDYAAEKARSGYKAFDDVSLEDWVIRRFGRTMFDIYFKEYSEKVWGIDCDRISAEWVAKRIQGLSLGAAIKNAFFKFSGKELPTLADKFLYPSLGIGRISDKLKDAIDENGSVLTNTRVERLYHSNFRIQGLTATGDCRIHTGGEHEFISSIPMTALVRMLHPAAPADVLAAASRLRYRDLVVVAIMVDRERVTDQSWIYIPERKMALGRIHEPKNWSPYMAPADKTLLVIEYFCFRGDSTWTAGDTQLTNDTALQLESLGFIKRGEVADSAVIRVPGAYPLLEVGYRENYDKVWSYLSKFKNLHAIGRGGTFRYLNMDHAIETGLEVTGRILESERENAGKLVELKRLALVSDVV